MDYASGKPVDERVWLDMIPYFKEKYGNPSSVHSFGNQAREAVEAGRHQIADLIGAEKKEEIVFTSGGTESNNLAIKGVAFKNASKGKHIITTSIEHMSVLNPYKYLSKQGFDTSYLPVDEYGRVDLSAAEQTITDQTVLVSIAYANGEVGTIQPVKEIAEIAHEKKALLFVDAVAAAGQIPIDVNHENIDLLSLSSNDLYGPRGVGALYIKRGNQILPEILGGGQERGLRSGTENLPGIVGFGKAAELSKNEMSVESVKLAKLRDKMIDGIISKIPVSFLNGHRTSRLPNNVNIRFSFIEGESLILSLEMEEVYCSTASACTSKTLEPSHVLLAMGLKHEQAHGSLLFSLGKYNTDEDVDYVMGLLPQIVKRLRQMSPLTPKELIS